MGTVPRYLRHAARGLAGNPGFSAAGLLTLALGVGATTAVFGVAEPLLARRLPVAAPEELVLLRTVDPALPNGRDRVPDELFYRLTAESRTLSRVLALNVSGDVIARLDLVVDGEGSDTAADAVHFEFVTGNYFAVLGLEPAAGRLLTESDDRAGAEWVAVISHRLWERRFGGSPEAIGRQISLEHPLGIGGFPGVTVVGVAPPGFHGTNIDVTADLWMAFQVSKPRRPPVTEYVGGLPGVRVMARAREGVSIEEIQAEIDVLSPQLLDETWAVDQTGGIHVRAHSGARGYSDLRFEFSDPVLALGMAAGLVLLIVWTNLAALMLTRGIARTREMAVRLALGSGRGGIVGHFLAEGLILASAGGLLGLAVARWGTHALTSFLPPETGFVAGGPGARVFLFAAGVSLVGAIVFAILPGLRVSRMAIASSMKSSGPRAGRMGSFAAQKLIVGAQIAIAFFLLVGAGLFLRTLGNLRAVDFGFDPGSLIEFEVNGDVSRVQEFSLSGLERIGALPEVVSTTAYDRSGLLGGGRWDMRASGPGGEAMNVLEMWIGLRFFETIGIPFVSGETFPGSTEMLFGGPSTGVILSESLATRLFGNQDPVGQDIVMGRESDSPEESRRLGPVLGVVRDVQHDGPRDQSSLAVYLPGVPIEVRPRFAVRTEGAAAAFAPVLRRAVEEFDGDLRIASVHTLEEAREALIAPERFVMQLAVFFGLVSMVVASIGTFGVLWYSMTRRSAEIGIRMALGAQRGAVIGMFMKEAGWVVGAGVISGLLAALAGTRLITSMLFGVTPVDAASFGMAALILVTASLLAAWLPARHASRVDPLVALGREE